MEVIRTIPVKLDVPTERRADLRRTVEQFTYAENYTVKHGRNSDGYFILNKARLHDELYYNLREETDLPSNLCIRAYSKALDAIKTTVADWKVGIKSSVPEFREPSAVYDKRTLTIKDRSATLSTINGRVSVDYVIGDYQRSYLNDDSYERRMGTLHYREDEDRYYLHIVLVKEVEERGGNRILGVDLNLKNVAVTSTGTFYDGGTILWGKNHYFRVRRSLQDKGTRSAKQALSRLSGRENRFVLDRLHTISRRIIEEARTNKCSYIAVERLTDIRDRIWSRDDRVNRQLQQWAFRELQDMIAYKAAEYGIRVQKIAPEYTSQTCSKCSYQSSTNRDSSTGWFECSECGYSVDGDYNAAKNIGKRLLTLPEGKRPSGLGDGHLALKSGTVNGNGEYVPHDPEGSTDQESHAQA
ncbi:RNA-guided endonuclease InsQ/TnpB family protein [Halorarius litoreus]|uniref:RNA-guided endonuclease InsQ/TnpB family protein n=1 Tax=Halorarius litoreus TaxID=2962676 RepID=UPI0020CF2A29|nr:transposase [Halorarius litoreus]